MRIVVAGGDGFCGWPASLHLAARGHTVVILDNLSRRAIDASLGAWSLTPIASMRQRVDTWNRIHPESNLQFKRVDLAAEPLLLENTLREFEPDCVVHFAEQRAAPYSMKDKNTQSYTVNNNVMATHNLLVTIAREMPHVPLVHLGTMGVYGYSSSGGRIPEGYIDARLDYGESFVDRRILHPANPGSTYHLTKVLDQEMFQFYSRNYGLHITDLHQGIVWGTQTPETEEDVDLINRFDYDGDYGTVLNRFIVQAIVGHPLTVHGSGHQTRAFIHIKDMVQCIANAVESKAEAGRVRILNQMTETHRLINLADMISSITGAPIENVKNPRKEADSNELAVVNEGLLDLGLTPTKLSDGLVFEISDIASKYRERCDTGLIPCRSLW